MAAQGAGKGMTALAAPAVCREVAVMERTLEAIGEAGVDIVPLFFERFHAAIPDQRDRFYNRRSSEGQMVTEIIGMLLAQAGGEAWLTTMLRASVNTHHDHGGIELEHYRVTLDTLVAVLREAAGERWDAEADAVWLDQAGALFALISKYY